MGSVQNRFPQQERRKRWSGCWGGLSCFGVSKGGKRIVPASRIPEGNASSTQPNAAQAAGLTNQVTSLVPSLLAPPSSPASLSNSAVPSTAQSPSCFLSLSSNSPGGPSSAMFVTGPYAHETQLVSPPVFSTFTTEPSTAPFTPPPELAHLTTPSSPDVPFAQFLSSSADRKAAEKGNFSALYPGSPGDCLSERSAASPPNGKYPRGGSAKLLGLGATTGMVSQDTSFFCPATFAEYYLAFPHCGGRLSVSRESDVNGPQQQQQGRHSKCCKQEVEEMEAYRESFGFSADEIISTTHYVEISDGLEDDSFTMIPFTPGNEGQKKVYSDVEPTCKKFKDGKAEKGLSVSDAEIDYRRGMSGREGRRHFEWRG